MTIAPIGRADGRGDGLPPPTRRGPVKAPSVGLVVVGPRRSPGSIEAPGRWSERKLTINATATFTVGPAPSAEQEQILAAEQARLAALSAIARRHKLAIGVDVAELLAEAVLHGWTAAEFGRELAAIAGELVERQDPPATVCFQRGPCPGRLFTMGSI